APAPPRPDGRPLAPVHFRHRDAVCRDEVKERGRFGVRRSPPLWIFFFFLLREPTLGTAEIQAQKEKSKAAETAALHNAPDRSPSAGDRAMTDNRKSQI